MGLRAKVALILFAGFGATLGAVIAANQFVVLPELREAEARADRLSVRRVGLGLDIVQRRLADTAQDYGVWNDTMRFMASRDHAFLDDTFAPSALTNAGAHGALILDATRTPVFHIELEPDMGATVAAPLVSIEDLLQAVPTATPRDHEPVVRRHGSSAGAGRPFLFGLVSIKNNDARGDSPGWVVFYRFIDTALFRQLGSWMQIDFEAAPALAGVANSPYRDANDRIHWQLAADDGTALFRLSAKLPRSTVGSRLLPAPVRTGIVLALIVFSLILLALELQVLRPVTRMARHLANLRRSGNYALRLQPEGSDELAQLGRECDSLIAYVEHQHERLSELSSSDALSGIANRRLFDERLVDFTGLARRRRLPLSLLLCDIDAFKPYNDTLGHQAGDEVLRQFGALMREAVVRESDVPCRYGGEEFAVLLPDTGAEGAELVAARLHERLAERAIPHPASPVAPLLTVSIGIAVLDPRLEDAPSPESLVTRADAALYAAKRGGRNRTVTAAAV